MTEEVEFTFDYLWTTYYEPIAIQSSLVGRKYSEYGAEPGDFRQEAAAWLLDPDNRERLEAVYHHRLGDDPDRLGSYLIGCLTNEFYDYGIDIKAAAGGQDRATAYWYAKGRLKELLDQVFDPEAWHDKPTEGESRRGGDPAVGGNHVATLADVSQGLKRMAKADRDILVQRHEWGWTHAQVADELGISESAAGNRYDRAIARLLDALGGARPDPMRPAGRDPWRGRHAVSNAAAQRINSNLYTGN